MDTSTWFGTVVAIAAATDSARAGGPQSTTTSSPARPNISLTPSTNPAAPAGPMNGMQLIEGMDRPASTSSTAQPGNWVIAPLPFRNELLGAGLVLGAGYLYGARGTDRGARHSVAAAAGMYAEGGSWTALAAHRGYWSEQRYRTTAVAATGELLYDIELQREDINRTIGLQQQFSGISLEAAAKIGESSWLGIGYRGGDTNISIHADALPEQLPSRADTDISDVLLEGEWDTRDSDLYPSSGRYAQAEALIAREALGSDHNYVSLEVEWNAYRSMHARHVLAWRIAGKIVDGDAPFFAMSWFGAGVDLRGYTPGRYIGESMIAAQAEWRWQATPRWGFTAFGGAGKVSGALGDIDTDSWLPAGGVGVRFKLIKALPLNLRADFAWGREDSTFSLAVGEAF